MYLLTLYLYTPKYSIIFTRAWVKAMAPLQHMSEITDAVPNSIWLFRAPVISRVIVTNTVVPVVVDDDKRQGQLPQETKAY